MIIAADHGNIFHKPRKIPEILRHKSTPLAVKLAAGGICKERAHLALFDVRHGADLIGKLLPVFTAVYAKTSVHGNSYIKYLSKLITELSRYENSTLTV